MGRRPGMDNFWPFSRRIHPLPESFSFQHENSPLYHVKFVYNNPIFGKMAHGYKYRSSRLDLKLLIVIVPPAQNRDFFGEHYLCVV